jgi:hypothetical protein
MSFLYRESTSSIPAAGAERQIQELVARKMRKSGRIENGIYRKVKKKMPFRSELLRLVSWRAFL